MTTKNHKIAKRERRHKKIRVSISGTSEIPRLSVFRSNQFIYAQLINDKEGKTLVSASDIAIKGKTKGERAKIVGEEIAKKAKDSKISKVVFDRGGFTYTGRIKNLADGAREGGLNF